MSKLLLDLPLGNRRGTEPCAALVDDSHTVFVNRAKLFISDHAHYAALAVGVDDAEYGTLCGIDAEDMDKICDAWLAYRFKLLCAQAETAQRKADAVLMDIIFGG